MDPFAKPPTISDDYRKAEIYRQSSEVFYQKGFQNTSMAEIAESVDLTQGGLYYYIKGKRALLYAIMSYALDLLETGVLLVARRLEDPSDCLETLVRGYVRLISEEPSVMMMLAENEACLEPPYAAKIRQRKRVFREFMRDVVASLQGHSAANGLEAGNGSRDAAELTELLMDRIHSVPSWNGEASRSEEEAARQILESALGAVAASERGAPASYSR